MRAFFAIFSIVLSFLALSPLAIISGIITGSGNLAHSISRIWSRIVLSISGVSLHVEGVENIPSGIPVVFACNHASQFDIPILTVALPVQFRFIVKKELFKIPLFGLAMRRTGYIPIDRSGGKAALKSLKDAAQKIKNGVSVVVFPEGTRSPDGRLRPFKAGSIFLAQKADVPIVPVGISGSHRILPKGSLKMRPGHVIVRIGSPISASRQYNGLSKEELTKIVWQHVCQLLDDDNRPTA